jgi:ArsR family transcriptional regulator, virulence genes transcriptional regulator
MKYSTVSEHCTEAADLLDALSSEARLRILLSLSTGEMSVGALAQEVGLTQPAISQHLAKLRVLGFVSARREAQKAYYRCDHHGIKALLQSIQNCSYE